MTYVSLGLNPPSPPFSSVSNVKRVVGYSALYGENSIKEAFDVIEKKFAKDFEGCTLTELRYDKDVENRFAEEIEKYHKENNQLGINHLSKILLHPRLKFYFRTFCLCNTFPVLKKQGGSNRETFTVRKISNGVGVEKTWPLHSPNVEKVEVVRQGKVRRAKLFYLRDRVGKKAKVKELVK